MHGGSAESSSGEMRGSALSCTSSGQHPWGREGNRGNLVGGATFRQAGWSVRLGLVITSVFRGNKIIFRRASLIAQLVKNPPATQDTPARFLVRKIPWRRNRLPTPVFLGFPYGSTGKESACNAGDLGSIPRLGRSPGEGKGYELQYSGLENSMGSQRVRHNWATFTSLKMIFLDYEILVVEAGTFGFMKLREKFTLPFSITRCLFIRSLK